MAETLSPRRESSRGKLKFGSTSLPPGQSPNIKKLFQKHSRTYRRPRKDDGSSEQLLLKDRRIKAITFFNDAIQSFNADLDNYNKPSMEQLSSVDTSESFYQEEFKGDIEVVSKRVLSHLRGFNVTFLEPKLDLHIKFSQEKFDNKAVKIGVFGRLKAGKSTLLNALTHSKLFPTDSSNPETSVIVGLTHKDGIHIGPCTTDEFHGKGLKCPQLQDERGNILAQGSEEIIRFLEDINKNVRKHGTEQEYMLIKANVPALGRRWYKDKQIIIQDTPGLGEADNEQVKEVTENAFHSCSAFLYVVDCSKLSDHLDVTALNIIKQRDRKFFEDGRLLTLANHFDHTFQLQAKSKKLLSDPLKIKTDVREMILQGVHQVILPNNIVPCIAYWAWCTRVAEDMDEEDFEYWKKKYLNKVSLPPGFKPIEGSKKFVEDVSGIKTIENWLTTIADNGECLFLRSAISDVMYCVGLCMEKCVQFGEHVKEQAKEMGSVMASKAKTWNEAVDILTDIENELEKLRDVIGDAYDEDIQTPVLYLENTAKQQIEAFREKCCRKCSHYASNTEEEEDEYESRDSDYSDDSDEWLGAGEIELTMDEDSMEDVSMDVSQSFVGSTDHLHDFHDPNAYRLKDFRDDLTAFAQELETQLNSFLATVRFDHIPQAIPLQDFRDSKATLDLCASVFLTGQASHNQTECPQYKKYTPSSEEIEAIIMHKPLTLNQLRERASINELKLSWITRMRIWFQSKVGRHRLDKSNYIMTRKDVNSAIQFLMKNKCLDHCSDFLQVDIKDQIVECYYNEYSMYVRNILDEYERTCLVKMEENSKKMENEMSTLLETYRHNAQRQSYLARSVSYLESEKSKYMLNLPEEFRSSQK